MCGGRCWSERWVFSSQLGVTGSIAWWWVEWEDLEELEDVSLRLLGLQRAAMNPWDLKKPKDGLHVLEVDQFLVVNGLPVARGVEVSWNIDTTQNTGGRGNVDPKVRVWIGLDKALQGSCMQLFLTGELGGETTCIQV